MTRYAITLAAVAVSLTGLTFGQDKKPDTGESLKAELASLQGKWEQATTTTPGQQKNARIVKEVSGDRETVHRYDPDGKLLQTARATFKLSEAGPVRVFTFFNGEVIDGLGKGRKQSKAISYIYRLDGDEWIEVGGMLTNEAYAKDVPYLTKWKRVGAAVRKPAAVEGDAKLMQGEWAFTAQTAEGIEVPASLLKQMRLTIEGDTFRVTSGGDVVQEGVSTFDATQTPKAFDVAVTGGNEKGTKWLGIYKMDGDTVTACIDPTGKKRPTEFKAEKGSGLFMNVHTRLKK